jgi:trimeric autotransporter adhesin
LVATALTNSAATSGYDQNITTSSTDRNATMNLIIPTGCTLDANLTSINLPFSSGTATNTAFAYKNVGDINVTVVDNNWTAIDQNTNSDCIAESNTSTANTTGKVGCLVRNFTLFHFLPKRFNNTFAIANFNSGNFTYLSNDSEMNATASLTATAVLENNTTATNYTAKCYAQDIDYTIALITNPSSTMWGSNYDTAINRIYFMGSSTAHSDANATGQSSFSSSEGNFTNGSATVTMFFNFDRNSTLPDQPFTIGKTDFNITSLIDSNNTSGTDFNRTDTNTTSLFYYGRAFAPDYTFVANPGTAKIYYEVYCKDCTSSYRTTMGIDGNESVHAINWYQNTNHAPSTMGTIAPVPSTTSNFSSYTTDATANPSTQTLTAASVPLTDKINLNSDTWLQYYPSYYTVTFTSSGNWAGAGTVKSSSSDTNVTGATIDATIKSGTRVQKRLNW